MKRFLLIFFVVFTISKQTNSATYYFSSVSGDDSRSSIEAKNPDTPWKTLNKMNSIFKSLQPGDSILFKRGEIFYGSMSITKSGTQDRPLVVGSFGTGPKPIITSLVSLVDWVDLGNGIYESSHPLLGPKINVVLLNNTLQEMGRYPNSDAPNGGYLNIESVENNNSLSSSELPPSTDWTGAEVVIRKSYFTIDRHPITAHSGTSITFAPVAGTYNTHKNFGFFIQDHPGTLDKLGEWIYDASSKKLKMFFGPNPPDTFHIQASTIDDLVTNTANTAYVILENLCLQGANNNSVFLEQGKNFEIKEVDIEFSGENGLKVRNLSHLTVDNCNIFYSNNNGINLLQNTSYATIINNKVEYTSTLKGMGLSGVGNGYGIHAPSDNSHVEFNQVLNTGYIGIRFGGNYSKVMHNYIDNFCLNKDDGAGIYTWTGPSNENFQGRKITGNIILNGKGAKEGTPLPKISKSAAEGIYIDDNASGIEITHNTIAHTSSKGIYIHNARDLVIENNTIYNNQFQIYISQDAPNSPIRNNVVTGNIFFSKHPHQNAISIHSNQDDIHTMVDFNNNYFVGQENQLMIHNQKTNDSAMRISTAYDLKGWKEAYGKNALSKKVNIVMPSYKIQSLTGPNRYIKGNFDDKIEGLYCFSPSKNCEISWSDDSKLDGGSLKVSSRGLSFVLIGAGPLNTQKNYILRFSALADKEESLKVFLRQSASSYHTISEVQAIKLGKVREEYEIHFSSPTTESNSSFVFESGSEELTYWLDNIEFYEAQVETSDPNEYIQFEYNSSKVDKTILLDGKFVDVKNQIYEDSLVLSPFSSIILLKD